MMKLKYVLAGLMLSCMVPCAFFLLTHEQTSWWIPAVAWATLKRSTPIRVTCSCPPLTRALVAYHKAPARLAQGRKTGAYRNVRGGRKDS